MYSFCLKSPDLQEKGVHHEINSEKQTWIPAVCIFLCCRYWPGLSNTIVSLISIFLRYYCHCNIHCLLNYLWNAPMSLQPVIKLVIINRDQIMLWLSVSHSLHSISKRLRPSNTIPSTDLCWVCWIYPHSTNSFSQPLPLSSVSPLPEHYLEQYLLRRKHRSTYVLVAKSKFAICLLDPMPNHWSRSA